MMKAPALLATLLFSLSLSLSLPSAAATVVPGQSAAQVIEALGKPMGTIGLREKTLLLYPQGEVTLKDGLVTEVDLMNEEQFEADQERLRREREEWLADQERRAAGRIEEAEAIRADKMQSRAFAALPAKDRVDYWRSLQARYPEIDLSPQIAKALDSYQSELEELRSQQRIAQLEARVAQAEKEAATARLETKKLREETERTEQSRHFGLRYYSDPVIRSNRYYYRPPTITIFTNSDGTTTQTHHQNGIHRSIEQPKHNESVAERATRILQNVK